MSSTTPRAPASAPVPETALPHNLEAEVSLLGSLIRNNAAIGDVVQIVTRDDFYREQHRALFEVVLHLYNERKPIDLTILKEELTRRGALEKAGGAEYLVKLVEDVPVPGNAEHYARIVRERSGLRRLIQAGQTIMHEALEGRDDLDALIDRAEKRVFEIASRRTQGQAFSIYDLLHEVFKNIEDIRSRQGRITGLSTGYFDLDDLLGGIHPSQLVIVAGRPSMGKTSFALNIAEHVGLVEKKPVLVFSLEMSRQTLAQNMLCSHTRISSFRIRTGKISDEEIHRLALAAGSFEDAPIFIDDASSLSVLDLRARARRLKRDRDIQLIVLDSPAHGDARVAAGEPPAGDRHDLPLAQGPRPRARHPRHRPLPAQPRRRDPRRPPPSPRRPPRVGRHRAGCRRRHDALPRRLLQPEQHRAEHL